MNDSLASINETYPPGFYWVKIPKSGDSFRWEPAYFNGDEDFGWSICSSGRMDDPEIFLEVRPLEFPEWAK